MAQHAAIENGYSARLEESAINPPGGWQVLSRLPFDGWANCVAARCGTKEMTNPAPSRRLFFSRLAARPGQPNPDDAAISADSLSRHPVETPAKVRGQSSGVSTVPGGRVGRTGRCWSPSGTRGHARSGMAPPSTGRETAGASRNGRWPQRPCRRRWGRRTRCAARCAAGPWPSCECHDCVPCLCLPPRLHGDFFLCLPLSSFSALPRRRLLTSRRRTSQGTNDGTVLLWTGLFASHARADEPVQSLPLPDVGGGTKCSIWAAFSDGAGEGTAGRLSLRVTGASPCVSTAFPCVRPLPFPCVSLPTLCVSLAHSTLPALHSREK